MHDHADLIGIPYEPGGRGPGTYDCYGLVRECLRRDGIIVPDYTSPKDGVIITALFAMELRLWELCEPQKGVMAVLKVPGNTHCGYMLNPEYMLHTWKASGGVVIEPVRVWGHRLRGFYRYVVQ